MDVSHSLVAKGLTKLWRMCNVLVEINASVRKLSEGSSLLELSRFLCILQSKR